MSERTPAQAPLGGAASKRDGASSGSAGASHALHGKARLTEGYDAQVQLYAPAAKKELTPAKLFAAYEATRKLGFAPAYIGKLEAGLNLTPTMSPSPELAKAIADREAGADRKPTGQLGAAQRQWLAGEIPALADEAPFPEVGASGTAARSGSAAVPENQAVQNAKVAPSYTAYLSQMSKGSFLGHGVVGHPQFLARVAASDSYLAAKTGKSPAEIGEEWGVERVVGFRGSTPGSDEMHHGTGFAIDVNNPQNDWNFGNGPQKAMMEKMMSNVAKLFGQAVVKKASDLAATTAGKTTEEIFDQVSASNEALKRYRSFAADPAALSQFLESDACPAAAKAIGVQGWTALMATDEAKFSDRTMANPTQEGPAGFMDQRKELVVALRDVGGLRWGATDFGANESGDVMHFDGHFMPLAAKIRRAKVDVTAAAAKQTGSGGG